MALSSSAVLCSAPSVPQQVFTITEKHSVLSLNSVLNVKEIVGKGPSRGLPVIIQLQTSRRVV